MRKYVGIIVENVCVHNYVLMLKVLPIALMLDIIIVFSLSNQSHICGVYFVIFAVSIVLFLLLFVCTLICCLFDVYSFLTCLFVFRDIG